jgi:hypothetical protein
MTGAVLRLARDLGWAVQMFRARRFRRSLSFSGRERHDSLLRPILAGSDGRKSIIAYPDAIYHARPLDFARARDFSAWDREPPAQQSGDGK